MSSDLSVLSAAPAVTPRKETVDVPEWGGAVVVRGLTASELFAIQVIRQQAIGRAQEAVAEHRRRLESLPADAPKPQFSAPELSFGEAKSYGHYISHMLHAGVTGAAGLPLYSVEQWELSGAEYPAVYERLQAVVERLSGLNAEDVRKN